MLLLHNNDMTVTYRCKRVAANRYEGLHSGGSNESLSTVYYIGDHLKFHLQSYKTASAPTYTLKYLVISMHLLYYSKSRACYTFWLRISATDCSDQWQFYGRRGWGSSGFSLNSTCGYNKTAVKGDSFWQCNRTCINMHNIGVSVLRYAIHCLCDYCILGVPFYFAFSPLVFSGALYIIPIVRAPVRSVLLLVIDILSNTAFAVYVLIFLCSLRKYIYCIWIHYH